MEFKPQIGNSFEGMARKAVQEIFEENMDAVQKAMRSECADRAVAWLEENLYAFETDIREKLYADLRAAIEGKKEGTRMNKLESLEEYRARQPQPNFPTRYSPTGVACPKCGNEMVQDTMVVLTSMPPKKLFVCQSCGQNEYV